jgi:CheY-like chemotaxis protein
MSAPAIEKPNSENWSRIGKDFKNTAAFTISTIGVGFLLVYFNDSTIYKITALIWAMACLASGGIIGFLFGIPKVLQNDMEVKSDAEGALNSSASKPYYRMQVNTNLEQISDWLTKIIVGVGLIELRRLPELLTGLSDVFSKGMGGADQTKTFSSAVIVYFFVIGFVIGYLMTRIYLAQAFSRADWGAQNPITVGGQQLTLEELSRQQNQQLADLRTQVVDVKTNIANLPPEMLPKRRVTEGLAKIHSILWVDDNPSNNSSYVEQLNNMGINVETALSTSQAMAMIRTKQFDRIISDMGRTEEKGYSDRAGVELLETLRSAGIDIPVLFLCAPHLIDKYRREAESAGAVILTNSFINILESLQLTP